METGANRKRRRSPAAIGTLTQSSPRMVPGFTSFRTDQSMVSLKPIMTFGFLSERSRDGASQRILVPLLTPTVRNGLPRFPTMELCILQPTDQGDLGILTFIVRDSKMESTQNLKSSLTPSIQKVLKLSLTLSAMKDFLYSVLTIAPMAVETGTFTSATTETDGGVKRRIWGPG